MDPTALYLDEPTSGLSSSDSMLIMKAMWSLLHLQVCCVFCSCEGAARCWEQNTSPRQPAFVFSRDCGLAFYKPPRHWSHNPF